MSSTKRQFVQRTLRTKKGTLISKTPTGYRYRTTVDKRQCYFPLGVDATRAMKRADDIRDHLKVYTIEDVREKFHPKYSASNGTKKSTSVKNLLKVHEAVSSSLGIKPRTAKDYRRGLVRMIQLAFGVTKQQALNERIAVVNESLVWKAKRNYLNGNDCLASKRTFNSVLRATKSMFTKEALAAYKGYEPTWDFSDVRKAIQEADQFKRVKVKWQCPPEALIKQVHWNIENVAGGEIYSILAMAFYSGLRCSEISALTTFWVNDTSPSSPDDVKIEVLNAHGFVAKGRQGYTIMKRTQWERVVARKTAYGSCVVRYKSPRTISKKASEFLRDVCGLRVQKPLHELRKMCGAYFATKHGLYEAQNYLRHEDPKTTYDHYAGVILSDDCLTLWDK